jgi:transposase-like protein
MEYIITKEINGGRLVGEEQNILKMYYDYGLSFPEIAKRYNYKDSKFIRKFFKDNGYKSRSSGEYRIHDICVKYKDDIIRMYLDNESSVDISKKYNIDVGTVLNCLRRNNIKIRNVVEARNTEKVKMSCNKFKISDEDSINYIIECYKNGKTVDDLAKEFSCDNMTLKKILLRNSVIIRGLNNCQTDESNEKRRKTLQDRYGINGVMHNEDFFIKQQKSAKKYKKAIIDGVEIVYQGYELKAIYRLIDEGYNIKEIENGKYKVPKFQYLWNGKNRIYYPDIFIPKDNRIVEAKSSYFYEKEKERNLAKRDAVLKNGYKFDFYIMDTYEKEMGVTRRISN